ncbi:hypothetical protein KBB17_00760 [Candidatus Saccharibacteria bacterium]|jgi:hypothetical protein|nr:hypothetical protein [Candidatus Saccharibacteria bacterium]MBP9131546.1 hypothetical protein [Candidatus Saccharibacteria bacterium]
MKGDITRAKPNQPRQSVIKKLKANSAIIDLPNNNPEYRVKKIRKNSTGNRTDRHFLHEITHNSVARNSAMFGAVFSGLLVTIILWELAKFYGYSYNYSVSIMALLIGGFIGLSVELIVVFFNHKYTA